MDEVYTEGEKGLAIELTLVCVTTGTLKFATNLVQSPLAGSRQQPLRVVCRY